jgi:hypothetical protein
MNLMRQLWQDEAGVIVSTEIMLITMILVFGLIAGLVSFRDGVAQELADTGKMVNALNQSYSFASNTNTSTALNATTPGSVSTDFTDSQNGDVVNLEPSGLNIVGAAGAIE